MYYCVHSRFSRVMMCSSMNGQWLNEVRFCPPLEFHGRWIGLVLSIVVPTLVAIIEPLRARIGNCQTNEGNV